MNFFWFAISIYFFFSTLIKADCFSAECPSGSRLWLVGSFVGFYALQALMATLFMTKNRKLGLNVFWFTSLIFVPLQLAFNIWGNFMIEEMESNGDCKFNDIA